ncbi:MAG TPA: helix-turn-helix domain-containing protein [Candidatus Angelobacter sp.]|nr:helix-turn-helix domain-containing protein [Candidatus Angelobacter sp.]
MTKRKLELEPELNIHYAVYKKRSICGLGNASTTRDAAEVTCQKCKQIMRRLFARPQKKITAADHSGPSPEVFHQVGQRIQALREKKHLTRPQVARSCGVSPGHLHRIEHGDHNITLKKFFQIVAYLGSTLESALAGIDLQTKKHSRRP